MRAFLIAAVVCITALTFYLAARLTSSSIGVITAEQIADAKTALDVQLAETQSGTATEIATLQEAGSALEAEIDTLTQSVQSLTTERDDLAGALAQTRTDIEAANAELAGQTESVTDKLDQMSDLETQLAERDVRLADADATIQTLNETIAASRAELEAVSRQMAALQQEVDTAAARIAVFESELDDATSLPADTDEQVSLLQSEIAERDTLIASFETQLAEAGTRDEDADAQITTLTAAVEERDATITALETAQAESAEAANAETAEVDNNEELAVLTSEHATQVASLDNQIAELTGRIAAQTGTIENLRLGLGETPVSTAELAELCVARANGILDASQISFGTGTTAINDSSVATLERLRDLVIGCKNDDLIIEIGGHTDSQGAEADNQALSEKRAQAVLDFLVDRSISSDTMRAVGFGETQPIETNDSSAGRAANRRITFEWQTREIATGASDETVPDTVDE